MRDYPNLEIIFDKQTVNEVTKRFAFADIFCVYEIRLKSVLLFAVDTVRIIGFFIAIFTVQK